MRRASRGVTRDKRMKGGLGLLTGGNIGVLGLRHGRVGVFQCKISYRNFSVK